MFIRWKQGRHKYTAYLVKSVRKQGKPCQEVIAPLCSLPSWDAKGGLIGWAHLEMKVQELGLNEDEQAHIYQLFAQKVPRPPDEMLEKEKRSITAMIAQAERYKAPVVPNEPPVRLDPATTTDDHISISWAVKIVPHNSVKYTASLVRQQDVIELGTIDKEGLNGKYKYDLNQFWLAVHSALCLANVDYKTYVVVLRRLETWVQPLPLDAFIKVVRWHLYTEPQKVEKERRAIHRRLVALDKKERELYDVSRRGKPIIDEMWRSAQPTQNLSGGDTTE